MAFNADELRARFRQLTLQRDEILDTSPRKTRDEQYQSLTVGQLAEYDALIREHEKDLFDIENERGMIVRALKGQTGE